MTGDGKFDLVIGDSNGLMYLLVNTGKKGKPEFSSLSQLTVAKEPFKWTQTRVKPCVVDWNNDGLKDIIFGDEQGRVMLLVNTGTAKAPQFDAPVPLKEGGRDMNGGVRCDPAVYDLNGDGKRDMITADEDGKVRWFENKGSDENPEFNGFAYIQARGWPIKPSATGAINRDMDGDGKADTIGSDADGNILLRTQTGTVKVTFADPAFKPKDGQAALCAADWNNDGKFDMIIVENSGGVLIALNTSEKGKLSFAKPTTLADGGRPMKVGKGCIPDFADNDKDGKKDLIFTDEEGTVTVFSNVGTDAEPKFKGGKKVEKESSDICAGYRARVTVADWNNDKKPDLIYAAVSSKDNQARLYVFLAK